MSNPVKLAQNAREHLARALHVLQAPELPPELSEVTETVAEGMSALHQLEHSGGTELSIRVPRILETLQRALHLLQWLEARHPSLPVATDNIAQSLSSVFSLRALVKERLGIPNKPAAARVKALSATPALGRTEARVAEPDSDRAETPRLKPGPSRASAPPGKPQPAPAPDKNNKQRPPEGLDPTAKSVQHNVTLAAYSPSNFYRGLKGDDVVTHGGLFVATYNVAELGQPVLLWVMLPGGFEFRARGVVRWRRAAVPSGSQAPHASPGFGVQLLELSPGARDLIQRYTRNRDPLLYDDS